MDPEFCESCKLLRYCTWQSENTRFLDIHQKALEEIQNLDPTRFSNEDRDRLARAATDRLHERQGELAKKINPECKNINRSTT